MKRTIATIILATHLFNVGGYMLLYQFLVRYADIYANEQIAKGLYKPDELTEIKIPVHLPDIQDQTDFQGISGQVKLQNNNYNYVALKITRDTMFLMCIPNYEKTRLVSQNIIVAKGISDEPLAKRSHLPALKKAGTDEIYQRLILQRYSCGYRVLSSILSARNDRWTIPPYLSKPSQPPERLLALV